MYGCLFRNLPLGNLRYSSHPRRLYVIPSFVRSISTHHQEGRLCTQDRHVSKRISNVGTACKRACLCGMRSRKQLLTLNHLLLAWNVKVTNTSYLLSHGGGKVNEINRRRCRWRIDSFQRATNLFQHCSHCFSCFLASFSLLSRAQSLVGTSRAGNRFVLDSGCSLEPINAR